MRDSTVSASMVMRRSTVDGAVQQGLTLLHFSSQPELFMTLNIRPRYTLNTPSMLSHIP